MKTFGSLLEYISCKFVCGMATIILAAFTYWAGTCTYMTNMDLENLKVRFHEDNMWVNICWLVFVLIVFWGVSKILFTQDEKANEKRVHICALVSAIAVGIVGVIWVIVHNYEPFHDQLQVVKDAMDFLKGDYSDLKEYLEIYPHQIGLVFLYKILFSICPNHEAIYFVHVIWLMVIVYFTYAVTWQLFESSKISFYSIAGTVCFVPMYFYVNYAYGDLCMAACGILGIWCYIKLCRSNQFKYGFRLLLIMTFSYLARSNSLIVLIAMAITLVVHSVRKYNWRIFIISVALVLVPISTQKIIIASYEYKAEVDMLTGAPAILHVAMGMQETYEGPGYYNAYNLTTYVHAGKDAEAASDVAEEYIRNRIQEMRQDLGYTRGFYRLKALQQWNEPSLSGEISTKTFSGEPRQLVQDIYFGRIQEFLRIFRNRYIFVLYAGAFAGALCKTFTPKNKDSIWKNIIFVILIGEFLFSLLWENKSRYVMPCVVMLLPYGGYGLYRMQNCLEIIASKWKSWRGYEGENVSS